MECSEIVNYLIGAIAALAGANVFQYQVHARATARSALLLETLTRSAMEAAERLQHTEKAG